jgi:general secretion pathway protein D
MNMEFTGHMKRFGHFPVLCRAAALALAFVPAVSAPAAPAAKNPPAKASPAKAGAGNSPGDVYLKQITLDEAAQFISQIGKTSIVVTSSVANKVVSLYLRDVDVEGMVKNLCRAAGVWYRYDSQTKAYILMNAQEYQQDIAITRDEITRDYVLRHHNVVSIANAIAALFGDRVNLVEPVEEMPPIEMGGTSRNQSGSTGGNYGSGNNNRTSGGGGGGGWGGGASFGRSVSAEGAVSRRSGGSQRQTDARKEIAAISQAGLEASLDVDSSQADRLGDADVLAAAARQGPPINITYNKLHNLLLVRTSDEAALKDIDALVQEMDRPPRQVLLEMRILEVELGGDFRSVFDIGASGNRSSGPLGLGVGSGPSGLITSDAASGSDTSGSDNTAYYPRAALSLGNFAAETAPTAVWQLVNDHLRLRLQMLESENRVNVLATPMLVAANNQPARLFIGDEQVLVTGASSDSITGTTGATNTTITVETEQRNVGQTLIVLPRINADRSVTLTIDQDNSRVNTGGARMPLPLPNGETFDYPIDTVNTANLQVTAHARDGLTVAVGGMISQRVSDAEEKVPLLGDVPLLGTLFKKTVRSNVRRQIVLLITPHVLETPEESDALARSQENTLRRLDAGDNRHGQSMPDKPRQQRDSIFNPGTGLAAAAPRPEDTASGNAEIERFSALARAAADAVRSAAPDAAPPGGLRPQPLAPFLRKPGRIDEYLERQVMHAWEKDGLYVTALRVINLGEKGAAFAPTLIVGRWAAIVAERQQLAPAGGETSWTWVYAISRRPYEEAMEQP